MTIHKTLLGSLLIVSACGGGSTPADGSGEAGSGSAETGNQDMEAMADTIERIVRTEKGLPPNLDWPSARLYYYLGLEVELYTPLFVVSRVAGWSAHVIEQLDNNRLIRPRANYTGPALRKWVGVDRR